jgi:hypothetical protein
MNHDIEAACSLSDHPNRGPAGNRIGGNARQPRPHLPNGSSNAALLLPLRLRIRHAALHENVRTAAVPKALVGHLLHEEEKLLPRPDQILLSGNAPWVQENKPHRTGWAVGCERQRTDVSSKRDGLDFNLKFQI